MRPAVRGKKYISSSVYLTYATWMFALLIFSPLFVLIADTPSHYKPSLMWGCHMIIDINVFLVNLVNDSLKIYCCFVNVSVVNIEGRFCCTCTVCVAHDVWIRSPAPFSIAVRVYAYRGVKSLNKSVLICTASAQCFRYLWRFLFNQT